MRHTARKLVGIDENGLGPRLGPMTVTGVLLSVTATESAYKSAALVAGIGDSKSLCAHGSMRDVERFVLSMTEVHLGVRPTTYNEFLSVVSLESDAVLRSLCPSGEAPLACFDAPVSLPAFGGTNHAASLAGAHALQEAGVQLLAACTSHACAKKLNRESQRGRSRFDVDLDSMLSITKKLREFAEEEITVDCGKVGGRKSYSDAITALYALPEIVSETPARSMYKLRGTGTIAFVRDGDASEPAIALASLFGKYARELAVERTYRYYAQHIEGLARASGYHDVVTGRFIDATALVRKNRGIEDECFIR
jgi:ribonuclease HII